VNDKDVWFNLAAGMKLRDIMAFAPFLWNIIDIAFHHEFNSSLDFDFFIEVAHTTGAVGFFISF